MTNLTSAQKDLIAQWCMKHKIRANHISSVVLRDACESLALPNDGYFLYEDVIAVGELVSAARTENHP